MIGIILHRNLDLGWPWVSFPATISDGPELCFCDLSNCFEIFHEVSSFCESASNSFCWVVSDIKTKLLLLKLYTREKLQMISLREKGVLQGRWQCCLECNIRTWWRWEFGLGFRWFLFLCLVYVVEAERYVQYTKNYLLYAKFRTSNGKNCHSVSQQFIGACKEPVMVIVTELLLGGTLRKYLLNMRPKCLDRHVAIGFALDIARAMECLHSHGIIHRDLKPGNNLVCFLLINKSQIQ